MLASEHMPDDLFTIIRCFGCLNVVECFIEPRLWLSCEYSGMKYSEGWTECVQKMSHYFDGENGENKKIPFGYPISTQIKPSGGPTCESTLVFNSALPSKGFGAPKATISGLQLNEWPKLHVYCRSVRFTGPFLGPNTEEKFRDESLCFADTLGSINMKFKPDPYYWVVCSFPHAAEVHTQIWFIVDE
ncbi:uncharacterized protein DEA37_0002065 [Paragonimus westermani]|uniref:Uncharacterized protein n=1 Tax=Paragonimus westermani TaxID=34504 RepID=A0A5J4NJK6_9TREM|nr:uncharacterized protein DEA37_0002065 [Paragonimus westermani]